MKLNQTKKIWQKKSIRYGKYVRRGIGVVFIIGVFRAKLIEPFDKQLKKLSNLPKLEDKIRSTVESAKLAVEEIFKREE